MKQLMFSISVVKFSSVFSQKCMEVCAAKKFRSGIKTKEERIETEECELTAFNA